MLLRSLVVWIEGRKHGEVAHGVVTLWCQLWAQTAWVGTPAAGAGLLGQPAEPEPGLPWVPVLRGHCKELSQPSPKAPHFWALDASSGGFDVSAKCSPRLPSGTCQSREGWRGRFDGQFSHLGQRNTGLCEGWLGTTGGHIARQPAAAGLPATTPVFLCPLFKNCVQWDLSP